MDARGQHPIRGLLFVVLLICIDSISPMGRLLPPDGARRFAPQRANGEIFLEGFVRIWLKERLT